MDRAIEHSMNLATFGSCVRIPIHVACDRLHPLPVANAFVASRGKHDKAEMVRLGHNVQPRVMYSERKYSRIGIEDRVVLQRLHTIVNKIVPRDVPETLDTHKVESIMTV